MIETFAAHHDPPFKGFRVDTGELRAELIELGGILTRLEVPDRDGAFGNVLLGCPTIADYLGFHPHFNCLVGRYANRLTNARFALDGKSYRLDANVAPHHLHGGREGFSSRIWRGEAGVDAVVLRLASADGDCGYPGNLTVEAMYRFEGPRLTLEIAAQTDAPTPVSLTSHHYYNLSAAAGSTIADHEVRIDADAFLPIGDALTQLGEIRSVAGTPFDLREGAVLGAALAGQDRQLRLAGGFDHSFVLGHSPATAPASSRLAAVVRHGSSGRALTVHTNQPAIQLYTGNTLHEAGKHGARYPAHGGLCLETQQFPDAPNHANYPCAILRPGECFFARTTFTFSTTSATSR